MYHVSHISIKTEKKPRDYVAFYQIETKEVKE